MKNPLRVKCHVIMTIRTLALLATTWSVSSRAGGIECAARLTPDLGDYQANLRWFEERGEWLGKGAMANVFRLEVGGRSYVFKLYEFAQAPHDVRTLNFLRATIERRDHVRVPDFVVASPRRLVYEDVFGVDLRRCEREPRFASEDLGCLARRYRTFQKRLFRRLYRMFQGHIRINYHKPCHPGSKLHHLSSELAPCWRAAYGPLTIIPHPGNVIVTPAGEMWLYDPR